MSKEEGQKEELLDKLPVVEEPQVEEKQPEAPKLSKAEEEAISLGWKPKGEFDGDPEEWISAREFLRRGELFGRINDYKHEIHSLRKTVDGLVKHNQKMFENQYKEEVQEIKQQRKAALREGDLEVVEELDEKLDAKKEAFDQQKEEIKKELEDAPKQGVHPAWEPWVEQNRWYATDPELRGYADGVAAKIVADAQAAKVSVDYGKLLTEVSRKVKQRFSEKFPSQVDRKRTVERDNGESKQRASGISADLKAIEDSLDEGEKQMMNQIIRNSGMKKEEYLKQIQEYNKRRGVR